MAGAGGGSRRETMNGAAAKLLHPRLCVPWHDSAREPRASDRDYGIMSGRFGVSTEVRIPLRALLFRRTSEPSVITVDFDGEVFLVRVRRHPKARRYTLRIHAATREVVLTMPPRGSVRQANEFAQKHGAWIAARLAGCPRPRPLRMARCCRCAASTTGSSIGVAPAARCGSNVATDGALLCVAGDEPHVPRRVRDFLKREAKRELEAASRQAAQALGVAVARVSIRDQASRWGSCSTTGVLSYSWRLILAPPFVLEYLAAHEVAHLVEMKSRREFWRLVERICPHLKTRQGLARRARRRPASLWDAGRLTTLASRSCVI